MWAGRVLRSVRRRLQIGSAAGASLALVFLLLLGAYPGAACAADRWSDITDQEWESAYGITAAEAADAWTCGTELFMNEYGSVPRSVYGPTRWTIHTEAETAVAGRICQVASDWEHATTGQVHALAQGISVPTRIP